MASLIKPNERILHIFPGRGTVFSRKELFAIVGFDFKIIELLSGDYMLVKKFSDEEENEFASLLTKRSIRGPAILCTPQEID